VESERESFGDKFHRDLFRSFNNIDSMEASKIVPRIRILHGKEVALGPGKADLLALILETGSLSSAAKRMKISYMRAWLLIQTMNRCFREPLVRTERGGAEGGGAKLTACGERVLRLYREMETVSLDSIQSRWTETHVFDFQTSLSEEIQENRIEREEEIETV
jgi:molybdate transport system regulatory protein